MARSKFFNLWGQKAETTSDDEDDKDAKGATATGESEKDGDEEEADAEGDQPKDEEASRVFDDEDDDEEEDDEATKAEVAKVSPKARASIRRAERRRVHAIVKAAGAARVEAGLSLALGTGIGVAAARAALAATGGEVPRGGRLGLAGDMDGRRQPQLGSDAGSRTPGGKSDVDKAAAFILGAGKR